MTKQTRRVGENEASEVTKPWPAEKVIMRPIAGLVPNARNARTHSDSQVESLARLMLEYGWTTAILVDEDDVIIAGHGCILAAALLVKWRHDRFAMAPVMSAEGWSDEAKRAYILADNKVALNAGWDEQKLGVELADLAAMDFDLSLIGFSTDELSSLLKDARVDGLSDPEAAPPLPGKVTSALGDIWIMGSHRLACGDCTNAEVVKAVLAGANPNLMVTDPPYGVQYDADWRNHRMRQDGSAIGGRAVGKVMNDDRADWREAWRLFPGDVAYVWHADLRANSVYQSLEAAGFDIRAQIIWAKQQFAIGRGHYHFQHEPCWYAVKKGGVAAWAGDRKQTTLWEIDKPQRSETGHSTQKPIECMQRPIENNSKAGDGVYDPFMGSGTTLIASQRTGRVCFGLELNPAYIDVAVMRWQDFTGQRAILEVDGRSFEEVAAERLS